MFSFISTNKAYASNSLPNMTLLQLSAQEGNHYTEDMAGLHIKGTFQTNGEGKPAPGTAIDILIML